MTHGNGTAAKHQMEAFKIRARVNVREGLAGGSKPSKRG